MKETRLTKKEIISRRKHLSRFVSKKYLGRDHYRDNRGYFQISKDIQPVVQTYPLYEYVLDVQSFTVIPTGFEIILRPPLRQKYEVDTVSLEHNDVAAKIATIALWNSTTEHIFLHSESGGMSIPNGGVATPVFPVYHEIAAGGDHHPIGFQPLILTNRFGLRFGPGGAWTVGKIVTSKILYRRVL